VELDSPITYGRNIRISPSPLPMPKSGRGYPAKYHPPVYDEKVYSKDAYYPSKSYEIRVGRGLDETVVNVYIFPVRYNPVSGEVKIIQDARAYVTYKLENIRGTAPIDVENIIITSPVLKEEAQRLADFHNSTGTTSWVVTTDWIAENFEPAPTPPYNGYANDTTYFYKEFGTALPLIKDAIIGYNYTLARKIVAFLQNETYGNNVSYVTIFGNAMMVPPSYYWVDQYHYILAYLGLSDMYDAWIPTDAFYASPDYTSHSFDFTPNFFLGRLPVNPLTAKAVVDKIIYYANHKSGNIENVTLSGGQVFETPYFLGETGVLEPINSGWMDGVKITHYFHTLRNYTYNNFVEMMKNSDMIIEITHGSGFSFWHHNDDINAWDFSMNASYGSLPIYISGSCLNGAWDEEMYPSEFASGINGGTSIAEKMLYTPDGIIAYFGGDREAYGSTAASFENGILSTPNNYGDLITEDGTIAGYYTAMEEYGYATLGMLYYYALYYYNAWVPYLPLIDPWIYYNWNLWQRSYFEYSGLGDPALVISGSGATYPAYELPEVEIPDAVYNADNVPVISRGEPVGVDIRTDSPTVKAELLYLEQDTTYGEAYYDFILDMKTLTPVSSEGGINNFTYTFTPEKEGTYILSVYTEDGKNTRFYMACGIPSLPGIGVAVEKKPYSYSYTTSIKSPGPDVQVITLLDYGDVAFGKETNVTAVVYNAGNETATDITVHFYLENYVLIFQEGNLSAPLVWLGNATIASLAPDEVAYVTIPWEGVNLIPLGLDPTNSSARWQYLVARAEAEGDVNPSNDATWGLFHVHLPVDVWVQKVFLEKDPAVGIENSITFEITNIGTSETATTNVTVMDYYEVIDVLEVTLAPGETKFLTVPWTPSTPGMDYVAVMAETPGDINTRNDVSFYYTNGYDGVYLFNVLSYDVAPVKLSQDGDSIAVTLYNYGPGASQGSTVSVTEFTGLGEIQVESPHPYPNNYDNVWEINVPGAEQIALHFAYLMVEPGYDYVYIYNSTGGLVTIYNGLYTDIWTPFINGSTVYVELYSDEMVNYSGFLIDSYATGLKDIGTLTFGAIEPGEFATKEIELGDILAGPHFYKIITDTPGEVATDSTGGSLNDVLYALLNLTDKVAPEIVGMSPKDVVINDRSPEIEVEWHDTIYSGFSDAIVKIDGIEIAAEVEGDGNEGTVIAKVPFLLADGEHEVEVTLVDNGGNEVTEEWSFEVDATAPSIVIVKPVGNNVALTYEGKLEIKGMTEPGATVMINGNAVDVDSNGMFDVVVNLEKGENVFYITATDAAGNTGFTAVTALYLPDLPAIWENISALKGELSDLEGELNELKGELDSLQGDVGELQGNISEIEGKIGKLKAALEENVSALNKAIEEGKSEVISEVNSNIEELKGEINDLKSNVDEVKKDVKERSDKQEKEIGGAKGIGYAGIVLGIIAIIIGIAALLRKPKVEKREEIEEENVPEDEIREE